MELLGRIRKFFSGKERRMVEENISSKLSKYEIDGFILYSEEGLVILANLPDAENLAANLVEVQRSLRRIVEGNTYVIIAKSKTWHIMSMEDVILALASHRPLSPEIIERLKKEILQEVGLL